MLSGQIIQVLDAIAEKMGVAVDWTAANVGPYLQQICSKYVTYQMLSCVARTAIFAIVAVLLWRLAVFFGKKYNSCGGEWDTGAFVCWLFFGIACAALFFSAINAVSTVIAGLTFPEKLILDYVQSLLTAS